MARRVLRGGREHTDMGGAICSVAAGHGRNWGCGVVTGCYGPLILGTRPTQGALAPVIETREGLPEEIIALVRPFIEGTGQVLFYNGGKNKVRFSWRCATASEWSESELMPQEQITIALDR
jgi:hypothetical protein